MAVIRPFRALRPQPEVAAAVAARPYDVLSSDEAREEARGNPNSYYHVSKSEIDLPEGTDPHSPEVYEKAAQNLDRFRSEGVLLLENTPCYYIYELTMDDHVQTGITAVSSVDDYDRGLIKKHELTRPDKEADRIRHMEITGAQTGNVFLALPDHLEINQFLKDWPANHGPVYSFRAADGIGHRIWVVDDFNTISRITTIFQQEVSCTYIADGHHRAASASKVRRQLQDRESGQDPQAPSNFFLTTIFPASQLFIMDYNRVVRDLNGLDTPEFLRRLEKNFEVEGPGSAQVKPSRLHEIGMYIDSEWYRLRASPGSIAHTPTGALDVTILQENLLAPILGVGDPRTDGRVEFIGGIRGLEALSSKVDSGEMAVAFALFPVTIRQLFDIADSGQIMPPKSTWFEPKLRDGLLTYLIR